MTQPVQITARTVSILDDTEVAEHEAKVKARDLALFHTVLAFVLGVCFGCAIVLVAMHNTCDVQTSGTSTTYVCKR